MSENPPIEDKHMPNLMIRPPGPGQPPGFPPGPFMGGPPMPMMNP